MTDLGEYSIERASHRLCAALHMERIDPGEVEILLPHDAWWELWTRIEQRHRGLMPFDGRGFVPEKFKYMGVTYRAKPVTTIKRPEGS